MKKNIIIIVSSVLILLLAGLVIYFWCFCRFYVPAGYMAVVTAKTGSQPKPGTILVEKGEKGIWREVLTEGRHFLDPVMYSLLQGFLGFSRQKP